MSRFSILILALIALLNSSLVFGQDAIRGGRTSYRNHYFDLGREALEEERYMEAVRHFNKSLSFDAYYADSYYLRAVARENSGDNEGALTGYNIILHMIPDHIEALFGRALLYFHLGKLEYAESDFLTLLTTPMRETNAIFFRLSNYESGVSGVMTMEGKEAEIHNYLGLVRAKLLKYDSAMYHFNESINLNGTDPNFYVNRGLLREELDQNEEARADYETALTIDPGNDLATYNLLRLSDDNQSIDLYTSLIDENPEFDEPYSQRGLAKYNIGDFRGALNDYNKAIEINAKDFENYLNRGMIREKLRDFRGAYRDYESAINLNPDYAKAYLNRGNLFTKERFFEQAIADYDKAISLDPISAITFYNRGVARYSIRDQEGACEDVIWALNLGMTTAAKAVNKMCTED